VKQCERCKTWLYDDKPCQCEPFEVYYPDYYGEEKETVYGLSFEDVVEKFAEEHNIDDPVFDEDIFEAPVIITDKNGIEKKFNCVAMIDVVYSVREIS